MSTTAPDAVPVADRFPSLDALREAHTAWLKAVRDEVEEARSLEKLRAFLAHGVATGAILDNPDDRLAAQNMLDYWATTFYRAGVGPPDTTLALYDPDLAPELDDTLCPYRGLDAFREEDSKRFFGRQGLLKKLLDRLQEGRLLAVVGPSGCGKSSLVAAGLLPALKAGVLDGSQNWRYLRPIVPGSDPRASLAAALAPFGNSLEVPDGPEPILLVIDQFEELFTLSDDAPAREQFLKVLLRLVTAEGPRHTVVLTMRLDYRERVAVDPEFSEAFEKGEVLVTPLTAGELREAIEKPAEAVGLKFEAGIVDRLVRDVLGEPAALPLLQFTLLKLWDLRERNLITWGAYNSLGNAREALARTAERFFEGLLPEEREEVERLLLRLVRPTEGWEVTSRRIRLEDLLQSANPVRARSVLDKLIRARLVRLTRGETEADDQIEIAHEALVRNWPRLVDWLVEERSAIQHRLALLAAARLWQERGEDPSALLRGSLLEEAQTSTDLNPLETRFVQASQAAADEAERAERLRQQRELDQARQLAEEQRLRAEAQAKRAEEQGLRAAASERLVREQEQHLEEKTRLVQWLRGLVAVSVIFAVTALTFALVSRRNAIEARTQQTIALQQKRVAEKATEKAVKAQQAAEQALKEKNKADQRALKEEKEKLLAVAYSQQVTAQTTPYSDPMKNAAPEQNTKYTLRLWPVGQSIRVKYLDGPRDIQAKVERYAREWTRYSQVSFDFDSKDSDAEVRLSFKQPGNWSLLGMDSTRFPGGGPTINLQSATSPDEAEVRRTVLHEFGHVLGLIHEWQNPNAKIKWMKDATFAYFASLGWDRANVQANVLDQFPATLPPYRSFDPKSVMCWPIPPGLTTNGIVVGFNNDLSESDKSFIAFLYPAPAPPEEVPVGRTFERAISNPRQKTPLQFKLSAPGPYEMEVRIPEGVEVGLRPDAEGNGPEKPDVRPRGPDGAILWRGMQPGAYQLEIQPQRLDVTGSYSVRITPADQDSFRRERPAPNRGRFPFESKDILQPYSDGP